MSFEESLHSDTTHALKHHEVPCQFTHDLASTPLTIIVSNTQKSNSLLKYLTELRIIFAPIVPDYLLDNHVACLFTNLEFERLNPHELQRRCQAAHQGHYKNIFLLCLVNIKDYEEALKNVTLTAFNTAVTLLLCWTLQEAAQHLQRLEQLIEKPSDTIEGHHFKNDRERALCILTSIPTINNLDAMSLLRTFGTLRNVFRASEEDLAQCVGIGKKKIKHLCKILHSNLFHEELQEKEASKTIPH